MDNNTGLPIFLFNKIDGSIEDTMSTPSIFSIIIPDKNFEFGLSNGDFSMISTIFRPFAE